jgi:hypothetical protein
MSKINYNRPIYKKGKEPVKDLCNDPVQQRVYLIVNYKDKEQVKSMGAIWDAENRLWYTYPKNPHIIRMKKWIHQDDYERCGIFISEDLYKLMERLRQTK